MTLTSESEVDNLGITPHLGKGNHGTIVEDGEEDDEDGGEVEVVQHSQQAEGEADTESHGHCVPAQYNNASKNTAIMCYMRGCEQALAAISPVLGVRCHALEDLPGANDCGYDDRESGLGQHDVCSTTGGIRGTCTG